MASSGCAAATAITGQPPTLIISTTEKPTAHATESATLTPAAPSTTLQTCTNNAHFIADHTIPDFSTVDLGAPLSKQWEIRNTGTCSWGPGHRVVFIEGSALNANLEQALYPAPPNTNAIVDIYMVAPEIPGDYQGYWQLYDPDGRAFGDKLYIKIKVIPPTVTPSTDPD